MAKGTLSKPVGIGPFKLPLWMWGAAGVGAFFVFRSMSGSGQDAQAEDKQPTVLRGPRGARGKRGKRGKAR